MGKILPIDFSMLSKTQLATDAQRMAQLILDLEQRLNQIHRIATEGTPDSIKRFIIPGFTKSVRLKHIIGMTAQFADLNKIQVADGPVRPVVAPPVQGGLGAAPSPNPTGHIITGKE